MTPEDFIVISYELLPMFPISSLPIGWRVVGNDLLAPDLIAGDAVRHQLDALKYNDHPRDDYGIEVMYRFAGFDPFERSTYFGPFFDLGQFERFRRIFHHSSYRVLLSHKDRKILSSLFVEENRFKQRIWIQGNRPEEEEIFEFTMFQRIGGSWDGYWLTESLLHDGDVFSGGMAY
ncbi:uncharacterized protein LOC9316755 isoform X2 [Arabidopsis lyrata subsp. lyrata]|uniref:uncharacterized protein LOC9316755 isoform X2 n=1 Tax=Arabidopsis lyrata subsp. lyrata TaxID=81972 RepID=UPI000A29D5F4|nr:uncharacterized protein LOC9316755 isoform X2 [Arabidopsis lyrata subsp. lyrata]|eukprot:XP_020885036.1 uncharacterized protein LOC9316755 isoform X2 [Arabidopsis lyrata subsp. lyrata]